MNRAMKFAFLGSVIAIAITTAMDATGAAVITGEAEPVSADGSFQAETGTIVGTITVP